MSLASQVAGLVLRGVVHLVDSALRMQEAQLEVDEDDVRDDVEVWEPYGFTAAPLDGAEGLAAAAGASADHTVLLCVADRRYRPVDLASGEVALYDNAGHEVRLMSTGTRITGAARVTGAHSAATVRSDDGLSGTITFVDGETLAVRGGIITGVGGTAVFTPLP